MDNVGQSPVDTPKTKAGARSQGDEAERLRIFKARFLEDRRAEEQWRIDRRVYGRFYDGDQLDPEEVRVLRERGQPPVVVNRVKPKIDAILGIIQELAVETKAFPMGQEQIDENEATEISERFRRVENASHFNEEEIQVAKDLLIDGAGYYETKRIWDGIDSRLITEHLPSKYVCIDKNCRRADLKDCRRQHKYAWKDLDDAIGLYPKAKDILEGAVNSPEGWSKAIAEQLSQHRPDQYQQPGDTRGLDAEFQEDLGEFVDRANKRVRIVTTSYRTTRIRRFLTVRGKTEEVTDQSDAEIEKVRANFPDGGVYEWTQEDKILNSVSFTWNGILSEKKDIRPHDKQGKFLIVRALAYLTRDEEKQVPYGLVKQHLDPQREYNKRRSKMLHLLNVNQVWFEDGAWGEDEKTARFEAARPDGWIKYRKEYKVDRITHENIAQGQFQLLQEAKQEIDHSGIQPEIEGNSKAQSGREFQMRLKEGLKSIREVLNNIRAARRRCAEIWLDDILVDMEEEANEARKLDPSIPPFKPTKYDVKIDEAPEMANLQSETFQELAELYKGGLPIPGDVLIEIAPIAPRYKSRILDGLKQAQAAAQAQAQAAAQQGAQPGAAQ